MLKTIIAAMSANHVIGKDNKLLWHMPEDLKRFKDLTTGHCIVMGRKTYESIIDIAGKPLPNRTSIVISRNKDYKVDEGCYLVSNVQEAFSKAEELGEKECFIIGGSEIYRQTLDVADKIHLTRLLEVYEGDAFFPPIDFSQFRFQVGEDGSPTIDRMVYKNFNDPTKISHDYMVLFRK